MITLLERNRLPLFFLTIWMMICLPVSSGWAQNVLLRGRITSADSLPMPDVIVRVQNTTTGVLTANDGTFSLRLSTGKHEISCTFIGYKPLKFKVDLQKDTLIHLQMTESPIELGTVYISPDGKDPAYGIIRQVRDRRDSLQKASPRYTYKAYTKTRIELLKLAKILKKRNPNLKTDTTEGANILYLAENFSQVAVEEPDNISETITASRVSGNKESYSLFSSLFLRFNIYQNFIKMPGVSERGFISPISDNTFLYYDFQLISSEIIEGHPCYRIAVKPKRKYDPVFAGTIWVADSVYCVQGFDLILTGDRQADQIDSLRIRQTAFPLPNLPKEVIVWKPVSIRFDFTGGPSIAKFGGYTTSVFSEYDLKASFPPKTFTAEVLKVADSATALPDSFWKQSRPMDLDPKEQSNYRVRDSLEERRSSPEYLDSLTRARARPKLSLIYSGYEYRNYRTERSWRINSLINGISYNTMEGLALELSAERSWRPQKSTLWSVTPYLRYGFASRQWNGQMVINLNKGSGRRGRFRANGNQYRLAFGKYVTPFGEGQISPFWNELYTLIDGRNYLRLYRRTYAEASMQGRLGNGLTGKVALTIAYREVMPNSSNYSWRKEPYFTENILFNSHYATVAMLELAYRPANQFISTPDGKIDMGSKYPLMTLSYRRGIPLINDSRSDFDFIKLEIKDETGLRLLGNLKWQIGAGAFLTDAQIHFPDYYHVRGNQTFWRSSGSIAQFSLMNYYAYSTNTRFVEAHAEYYFDGFFLNKIPLIRKLKWKEMAGAHYFYTPESGSYLEVQAGIERIFRFFRVDAHWRLQGKSYRSFGLTFSVEL